ncbi:MAG: hypothetical protein JXA23_12600 [Bacteroidales bacterium]|nr:hypothetical protein [Bacteroidales bacterium]
MPGLQTREFVDQSLESQILHLSLLFQNLTEGLSMTQVNYPQVLINEENNDTKSTKLIMGILRT